MIKAFYQLYDWKVHTNLANAIIEPSIHVAENYVNSQHPSIQYFCNKQIRDTTLTYHDTYNNEEEPSVDTPIAVRIIPRTITNKLSDKVSFAQSAEIYKLIGHIPKTYFSKEEAIASGGNPDRLLFVKLRSGTRGEHVSCIKYSDLADNKTITRDYIIQESIDNLVLYYGRKTVIRFYIFIFNKHVYISKHAGVIVHGAPYDPQTTDYKVHVQHNGDGCEAVRFSMHKLPNRDDWFGALKDLTRAILPILEPAREASSLFRYLVIGADGIPCLDNKVRLIELNSHPAIVKPPLMEPVYIPMFSSLMLMTVAGLNNDSWVKII